MFGFKKRRRARLRERALPLPWVLALECDAAFYAGLPVEDRRELRGHIQVFLAEKTFEGCGGFVVTDPVRVRVAAEACRLLLHRDADYYPRLDTILIYPHSFVAETSVKGPGKWVIETEEERVGESWHQGVVILAWDDVLRGSLHGHPGHNVILHEFAHQLDQENGDADGVPDIRDRRLAEAWGVAMADEFKRLRDDLDRGRWTALDPYGAESPAEFFAVATECFFEIPGRVRTHHPDLYEVLKRFYRQDPAQREEAEPDWNRNAYTP